MRNILVTIYSLYMIITPRSNIS